MALTFSYSLRSILVAQASALVAVTVFCTPVAFATGPSTTSGVPGSVAVETLDHEEAQDAQALNRSEIQAMTPAMSPAVAVPPALVDRNPRPLGQSRTQPPKRATEKAKAAQSGTSAESSGSNAAVSIWWSNPILRTAASLATVLSIIIALALAAKKLKAKGILIGGHGVGGGGSPSGILEILGRYPIARGQTLLLLKVDQRVLLIAQMQPKLRGGSGSMQTLCEITAPEDVASIIVKAQDNAGASASAKFQAMLRDFDARHAEPTESDLAGANADAFASRHRQTRQNNAGDRVELWDTNSPSIRFPQVERLADAKDAHRRDISVEQATPRPATGSGGDSFHQIKDRLSALRGEAHR